MTASPFLQHLLAAWPSQQWHDVTVVAAVSGGADSVALLAGLAALKAGGIGRLMVAHFNHGVRGRQSDEDEAWVRQLAEQQKLPCVVGRADDAAWARFDTGDGFEAAAREARYAFLADTAHRAGARFVATAHTADDQAETVLHRIVRGTGLGGLAGVPRTRLLAPGVTLIRPLLGVRREELRAYLVEIGQTWREDATNAMLDWTRNRIRGELLPRLAREYNPEVVEAILRLSRLAGEAQTIINDAAGGLLDRCLLAAAPGEVVLDTAPLHGQSLYLISECLIALWRQQDWPRQSYGLEEWRQLAAVAVEVSPATVKPITLPGAILARRQGAWLVLTRAVT